MLTYPFNNFWLTWSRRNQANQGDKKKTIDSNFTRHFQQLLQRIQVELIEDWAVPQLETIKLGLWKMFANGTLYRTFWRSVFYIYILFVFFTFLGDTEFEKKIWFKHKKNRFFLGAQRQRKKRLMLTKNSGKTQFHV